MKYLIFDTETSGLFDFRQPADAPGQPRLAQAGFIFLDGIDAEPRRHGVYVAPDGWTMDPKASAVNGLTDEFLAANGVPVAQILDIYEEAIESDYIMVAYNAQFDTKVMRAELRRAGRPDRFEQTRNICVMRPCAPLVGIPSPRFPGQFKWPKLEEACRHFGITNASAHDAMGDADAALEVFLYLHRNGLLPEPAIHYARERA